MIHIVFAIQCLAENQGNFDKSCECQIVQMLAGPPSGIKRQANFFTVALL